MQYAIWKPVSGKLRQSAAYQQFSAANDVFEYCNDGSPALSKAGRLKNSKGEHRPRHINFSSTAQSFDMTTMIFS
jgi:hypothetical protein